MHVRACALELSCLIFADVTERVHTRQAEKLPDRGKNRTLFGSLVYRSIPTELRGQALVGR